MATKNTDGRNQKGQFAPGYTGGPGRPARVVETHYLRILSESCPPEKFKQVVDAAVKAAIEGDRYSREWLSGYLVGSPEATAAALSALYVSEQRQQLLERKELVDMAAETQSLELMESLYRTTI